MLADTVRPGPSRKNPTSGPSRNSIRAVAERTDLPIVAAGGVRGKGDVDKLLQLPHVVAVSCGSAFLLADEAGTSPRTGNCSPRAGSPWPAGRSRAEWRADWPPTSPTRTRICPRSTPIFHPWFRGCGRRIRWEMPTAWWERTSQSSVGVPWPRFCADWAPTRG